MKLILLASSLFIAVTSMAAIPSQVSESYASQISLAKNAMLPMSTRWPALLKAAELASSQEINEIRAFTQSSDWYMRNAAMAALSQISPDYGIEMAKKLIHDKALVVRSAAIDLLATKQTIENRHLLANELSKPYNFKGRQSLWVRPQIIRHLASKATADDRHFFAKQLFDRDPIINEISANTLEKITDVTFTGKNQLSQWKSYVQANGWL
ncbi:MAG: hypothetical protein H7061_14315 [Bdellovibrionaceae bacterium]|nr:hypothetical protein [Bdellovibrio sp.]